MADENIKIIYAEKGGKPFSYQFLNRSESVRAKKILAVLSQIDGWIPSHQLAGLIGDERQSTLRTANKLVGAIYIIPSSDVLVLIKNDHLNPLNKIRRLKFLKPTIYL